MLQLTLSQIPRGWWSVFPRGQCLPLTHVVWELLNAHYLWHNCSEYNYDTFIVPATRHKTHTAARVCALYAGAFDVHLSRKIITQWNIRTGTFNFLDHKIKPHSFSSTHRCSVVGAVIAQDVIGLNELRERDYYNDLCIREIAQKRILEKSTNRESGARWRLRLVRGRRPVYHYGTLWRFPQIAHCFLHSTARCFQVTNY